jgi:hypothetical protein
MRWLSIALVLLPITALAQQQPECVRFEGTARWGADGYNHIVRIENNCARAASCSVSTDVNPQVQVVNVPAGQSIEIVTFLGSPASRFTPNVVCTLP